jgi:hypothetical protein
MNLNSKWTKQMVGVMSSYSSSLNFILLLSAMVVVIVVFPIPINSQVSVGD